MTIIHSQPVTTPLHVTQGYRGQTVTFTLPTEETVGSFYFLIGNAARSKRFVDDLTGLLHFYYVSFDFFHFWLDERQYVQPTGNEF